MKIHDIVNLPKMHRVIKVDLDVLRSSLGENNGVIYDCDTVVKRKVRRVLHDRGWRWQLVRECKNQEDWDYCFEQDKYCLDNVNHELGLLI